MSVKWWMYDVEKDHSDVFDISLLEPLSHDLYSVFFHRGSTGSTGRATNTQLNLQRWRLGQPTSEILRTEKSDHRLLVNPSLSTPHLHPPSLVSSNELCSLVLKSFSKIHTNKDNHAECNSVLAVRSEPGKITPKNQTISRFCVAVPIWHCCMCDYISAFPQFGFQKKSSGEFDEHEWTYSTCLIGTKHL